MTDIHLTYKKYFSNIIISGKFFLIAFFLVLSFINGYNTYICQNPNRFMWDSFTVGLTSALAIGFIAFMRGRKDLIPSLMFVSFFLFYVYNVLKEFSGLNAINEDDMLTDTEKQEKKILIWPAVGIVAISFIVLGSLAFVAQVPYPFRKLFIEGIVFAGLVALAEGVVSKNHNKSTEEIISTVSATFVLFFILNCILQYGGFYSKIFNK